MAKKKINLGVIFYGNEKQLKINEQQVRDFKKNLVDFEVKKYDFNKNEQDKLLKDFKNKKIDTVLKNSYGRGNEAIIESFLELNHIPYLGSDSKTILTTTSKFLAKNVFRAHNLPVAKDVFIDKFIWQNNKTGLMAKIVKEIGFPCLIKDVAGTDSCGIYKVKNKIECLKILNKVMKIGTEVIVEEFVSYDYEVTCMVVGNDKPIAYPPIGVVTANKAFLSLEIKNDIGNTLKIIKLPSKIINNVKKLAVSAHQVLGCKTFSRADILIKGEKLYLLEVDPHPGLRMDSPTVFSARYKGENLNELFLKFYNLSK